MSCSAAELGHKQAYPNVRLKAVRQNRICPLDEVQRQSEAISKFCGSKPSTPFASKYKYKLVASVLERQLGLNTAMSAQVNV